MLNFHMKREWLGVEEVPYESRLCPQCFSLNWFAGQNPDPCIKFDTEAIQCWRCKELFWIDNLTESEHFGNFTNALICRGEIDPVIPTDVLTTIIDAAADQFDKVKKRIRTKEDDPELVEIANEIHNAINYVKKLLNEGQLPQYNPPSQEPPPWI